MNKANDEVTQIISSHFINIICQMLTLFSIKFVIEIIHLKTVIKVQYKILKPMGRVINDKDVLFYYFNHCQCLYFYSFIHYRYVMK